MHYKGYILPTKYIFIISQTWPMAFAAFTSYTDRLWLLERNSGLFQATGFQTDSLGKQPSSATLGLISQKPNGRLWPRYLSLKSSPVGLEGGLLSRDQNRLVDHCSSWWRVHTQGSLFSLLFASFEVFHNEKIFLQKSFPSEPANQPGLGGAAHSSHLTGERLKVEVPRSSWPHRSASEAQHFTPRCLFSGRFIDLSGISKSIKQSDFCDSTVWFFLLFF